MNNLKHTDEIVADLVSEYVDQLNAGGEISLEKFLAAHSEYSAALRPLLQSAMTVRKVAAIPYANAAARATAFDSVMARLQKEEPAKTSAGIAVLDQREDCILLLLHFMKSVLNVGVWGNTKLVKMLLLLGKEADCANLVPNFYPHYAYNFGAFDKDVPKDADQLSQHGLITKRTPSSKNTQQIQLGIPNQKRVDTVFELTAKGEKVALALLKAAQQKNPEIVRKIEAVVKTHGNKTVDQLIAYTYRKYPDLAAKSLIKDKYLDK